MGFVLFVRLSDELAHFAVVSRAIRFGLNLIRLMYKKEKKLVQNIKVLHINC